jgi:hypothetical protein
MKQSPLPEFESSAFAVLPNEDNETNPGIYGKALAQWLANQLRAAGVPAGEVIAEDFGWCVPVESSPFRPVDTAVHGLCLANVGAECRLPCSFGMNIIIVADHEH